ncbi:MAG TPA: ABC transporter ATP-binding protein [Bacteroidota bacterium]|jgi:iron complex transport system ATP-binding protein|nr:ABC transporter ATP-binding protein [Bacteroidota bacterium]
MDILNVNNISVNINELKILDNISFNVKKGEILGIIGPNGSGKTTLFKTISRILKPETGNIFLYNKNITSYSEKELSKLISVIPQMINVQFPFTVEEFILMGRFPHSGRYGYSIDTDYEIVNNVIKNNGMDSIRHRRINELSGGEKQRVIIAQGFAQQTNLMLLDEPTSHLDIYYQVQLLNLLDKYNKECELTILIILHDLNLAASYCDRLIMMKEGKIFTQGTIEEVLTYQNIEAVYNTPVIVKENPIIHKPHVILVTKNLK